jgi:hypothetical protein
MPVHFTLAAARQLRDALAAEVGLKPRFQQVDLPEGTPMPKPTVNESKRDRQHNAVLAKGGRGHMFRKQAAGPAKRGITGKAQTLAPGAKAARGGTKSKVPDRVLPARAARTGVR